MSLPDNQRRCSICGRIKVANPTRHQQQLHDLLEQLDDAVIAKNRWWSTYRHLRRIQATAQAVEARAEADDWNNEINRLNYYIELCQQAIDQEAKLK